MKYNGNVKRQGMVNGLQVKWKKACLNVKPCNLKLETCNPETGNR